MNNLKDRIFLFEAIENPFPVLKNAIAFISTSKYEGFPLSILESMLLKVPVISTKYSCYEDLLELNNSIICEDYEPSSFARLIEKFLNGSFDIEKIIENAFRKANLNNLDESKKKYCEILDGLFK